MARTLASSIATAIAALLLLELGYVSHASLPITDPVIASDDECDAGDEECGLSFRQLRGMRAEDSEHSLMEDVHNEGTDGSEGLDREELVQAAEELSGYRPIGDHSHLTEEGTSQGDIEDQEGGEGDQAEHHHHHHGHGGEGGEWSLNGHEGPFCAATKVPSIESASAHAKGDGGWDPCCYHAGCNILSARKHGGGKATKWYDAKGKRWTGYVYDKCPGARKCIATATTGWESHSWMREQCGKGKPVCENGGIIEAPKSHGKCEPHYRMHKLGCIPCPGWKC